MTARAPGELPGAGAASDENGPPASPPAGRRRAVGGGENAAEPPVAGISGPRLPLRAVVVAIWVLGWLAATAAAATAVVDVDTAVDIGADRGVELADWVPRAGGGVVTVLYAAALAHRVGASTWLWTGLAAVGTAAGLVAEEPWALSTVAVLAAVVSGGTAVLLTRPAHTAWRSLVECLVALVLASAGALAVAGINAPVRPERFTLVVAGLALALAIWLVWRLGPERHGLGRRGLAAVIGGAVAAVGLLAYTQVLRRYGSPEVVERLDDTVTWLTDTLHGVPRPVAALVGFPALVWGCNARGRRPSGWWPCVFGVLGTAVVASSLAPPRLDPELAALSTAYSVGIGAVLGLVLWRIDVLLTRPRNPGGAAGRRAVRRDRPPRPEPGRTRALG